MSRAASPAVVAAAAALGLLALSLQPRASGVFAPDALERTLAEQLLHGLPGPSVSLNPPMQSVVTALAFGHAPSWFPLWAPELLRAATLALVFTLGATLHSLAAGGAAAALTAAAVPFLGFNFMSVYAVLVLLAANALAWAAGREEAGRPSWPAYAAAGSALGLTLLQRSPLFLLPFVLAGHLWARRRSRGEPAPVREALALIAPPLLMLAPWMRLNWLCFGTPTPFELGRARFNIITGALGHVSTLEGVLVNAGPSPGEGALAWAALRVLRHPLDFLAAVALRLAAVVSWHPWLTALTAYSAWSRRASLPHRQASILAAYFLAIHCLMPVKPFYFEALWPVASALAACGLAARLFAEGGPGRRASSAAAGGLLAGALGLGAYTMYVVSVYPGRAAQPSRLAAEAGRRPDLACLRTLLGRQLLRQGRAGEAAVELRAALLAGARLDRVIDLAWALLALRAPGGDLIDRADLTAGTWDDAVKGGALRALGALQRDRRPEALAAFVEAERRYAGRYRLAFESVPADRDAQRGLESSDAGLSELVEDLLLAWPEEAQASLRARLRAVIAPRFPSMRLPGPLSPEELRAEALAHRERRDYSRALSALTRAGPRGPRDAGLLLDWSAEAARHGQASAALGLLAAAERSGPGPENARRLVAACRDLGLYERALSVLRRPGGEGARDPETLRDLSVRAAADGRRATALAFLALAETRSPGRAELRLLALAYRGLGDAAGAARVRRRAGDAAGMRLDRAESAAAAGDRGSALAHLARARAMPLDDAEARRLVLLYQGVGEYAAALEVADLRVKADPGDARWLSDRGVLHALRGDREAAAADWRSALALDPGRLAAYLSLGTLYSSTDRRGDALEVYQRAISRRHTKADAEILRRILAERRKLLF